MLEFFNPRAVQAQPGRLGSNFNFSIYNFTSLPDTVGKAGMVISLQSPSNPWNMERRDSVRKDACGKIRSHIEAANICMVSNSILEWSLQPESLGNQWLDDEGNVWLLSMANRNSATGDGRMEIFYSNRAKSSFLSLVGDVRWASFDEAADIPGFPFKKQSEQGVRTPLRLAKFTPNEAFYWDEVLNDMVPIVLFDKDSKRRLVA